MEEETHGFGDKGGSDHIDENNSNLTDNEISQFIHDLHPHPARAGYPLTSQGEF